MKIPNSIPPLSQPRSYAPVGTVTSDSSQTQPQTAQASSSVQAEGLWSGIKNLFKESWNVVKGLFARLFPPKLTTEEKAIATQYHLQPTKANVAAFLNEANSYESDGTLGPGTTNKELLNTLQTALKDLGYAVDINGNYDDKTMAAVIAFKKSVGICQTYKGADGNWAVNEYATQPTLAAIMKKLESR